MTYMEIVDMEELKGKEEIQPTGDGARLLKTEPGSLRELDAEIAFRVLGWTIAPEGDRWRVSRTGEYVNSWCVDSPNIASLDDDVDDRLYGRYAMPCYSVDIEAAWEVVERLRARRFHVGIGSTDEGWECVFFAKGVWPQTSKAPTLPEAICRAALALVNSTDEEVK